MTNPLQLLRYMNKKTNFTVIIFLCISSQEINFLRVITNFLLLLNLKIICLVHLCMSGLNMAKIAMDLLHIIFGLDSKMNKPITNCMIDSISKLIRNINLKIKQSLKCLRINYKDIVIAIWDLSKCNAFLLTQIILPVKMLKSK